MTHDPGTHDPGTHGRDTNGPGVNGNPQPGPSADPPRNPTSSASDVPPEVESGGEPGSTAVMLGRVLTELGHVRDRLDSMEQTQSHMSDRLDTIEQTQGEMSDRLDSIEQNAPAVSARAATATTTAVRTTAPSTAAAPAAAPSAPAATAAAAPAATHRTNGNGVSLRLLLGVLGVFVAIYAAGLGLIGYQITDLSRRLDDTSNEVSTEIREGEARINRRIDMLANRVDALEQRVAQVAERVGRLEVMMAEILVRLGLLEQGLAHTDARLARVEGALDLPPLPRPPPDTSDG